MLGTLTLDGAPHINRETLDGQGLHRRRPRQGRDGAAGRLRAAASPSTPGRSARRRSARVGISMAEASQARLQPAARARLHRAADRRGQRAHLRHDDGRGRAAPEGRAPAGLRLRQQVRQEGHALHPPHGPHPDDGAPPRPSSPARSPRRSTCRTRRRSTTSPTPTSRVWTLGLKAMALYRDGSKLSQPLSHQERREGVDGATRRRRSTRVDARPRSQAADRRRGRRGGAEARAQWRAGARRARSAQRSTRQCRSLGDAAARVRATPRPAPYRRRLPAKRRGFTQEARVAGQQGLPAHRRVRGRHARRDLHRHAQGRRGLPLDDELLRDRGLEGPAVRRAARGVRRHLHLHPLRAAGHGDGHPNIKMATSIIDYVFRVLGLEYLGRTDLVQVPPELIERGRPDDAGDRADAERQPLFPAGSEPATAPSAAATAVARRRRRRRAAAGRVTPRRPPWRRLRQRPRQRQRQRQHARPTAASSATATSDGRRARSDVLDAQLAEHDGRRPLLRRLRPHHRPQRRLLQVPQLREQPGLFVEQDSRLERNAGRDHVIAAGVCRLRS